MEYSAGIVVVKDGEYLLVHSKENEEWGLPKGHLEAGETEEEAAHRELYEESGVTVELVEGFKEPVHYRVHQGKTPKRATYFLGIAVSEGERTHKDEIDEVRWCAYEEAYTLLPHDDLKEALDKAHRFLQERFHNT
ncbi:MAG: NUDIX domain-containing protein [Candidatus Woesearchaeota archaeon]